jgi:hypothetical protein
LGPKEIRVSVWDHVLDLVKTGRWVCSLAFTGFLLHFMVLVLVC